MSIDETHLSIQVYSDIHIESWDKLPEITPKAEYLFLAGDICELNHKFFDDFFKYCSINWKKVFYVPGNNEFYSANKNYQTLDFEYNLKLTEKYKNVFYLNNDFVSLSDELNIDVYGTTFWTPPIFSSTRDSKNYIKDYNYMRYFNSYSHKTVDIDIAFMKNLSNESFSKLSNHLQKTKRKTIVMTHFPPFQEHSSNPKYAGRIFDITRKYYAWPDNTLKELTLDHVAVWISGHTHWSYNVTKNGCRCISNQLGCKRELGETGVSEEGLFDIIWRKT